VRYCTSPNDIFLLLIPFAWTDISAVIHVASPFTGVVQDPKRDMLGPAIEGTLNVVRSAHKAGVKRMIITSSIVAVFDFAHGGAFVPYCGTCVLIAFKCAAAWRDYTYTANDWYDIL
jgi:nucleoside-diphosphate-sugar epimerase